MNIRVCGRNQQQLRWFRGIKVVPLVPLELLEHGSGASRRHNWTRHLKFTQIDGQDRSVRLSRSLSKFPSQNRIESVQELLIRGPAVLFLSSLVARATMDPPNFADRGHCDRPVSLDSIVG